MRIAVLGGGISGLGVAHLLSSKYHVDLYEKESRLGGHANTVIVDENEKKFGIDTGFLVFNHPTYPLLTKLFEKLQVTIEKSDMSFGFWDTQRNLVYNSNGIKGLFFQRKNLFSLSFYRMIFDILRFNQQANDDIKNNHSRLDTTLQNYLEGFSEQFKTQYLYPMGAAIWSSPNETMGEFPARTFVQFFKNHGLLGINTHHQWLTVSGGSIQYVEKIAKTISGNIILNSDVIGVQREQEGIELIHQDGRQTHYDKVILAMHAPDALALLTNPTEKEIEILSAFEYKNNNATLHNDTTALYPNKKSYASWNYKTTEKSNGVTLSYWINRLQNLPTKKPYFVSLNETSTLSNVIKTFSYAHPQFDGNAISMQKRHNQLSGELHTYYVGAYWRYGFHEDGLWSANRVAKLFGCEL